MVKSPFLIFLPLRNKQLIIGHLLTLLTLELSADPQAIHGHRHLLQLRHGPAEVHHVQLHEVAHRGFGAPRQSGAQGGRGSRRAQSAMEDLGLGGLGGGGLGV